MVCVYSKTSESRPSENPSKFKKLPSFRKNQEFLTLVEPKLRTKEKHIRSVKELQLKILRGSSALGGLCTGYVQTRVSNPFPTLTLTDVRNRSEAKNCRSRMRKMTNSVWFGRVIGIYRGFDKSDVRARSQLDLMFVVVDCLKQTYHWV